MHSLKLFRFAMTGLGLAVALTGCGAADTMGGTGGSALAGSGGTQGSGGTTGTGGAKGTGGATGTGGALAGMGGMSGTGGATGSGTGGVVAGSGGSPGTDGGPRPDGGSSTFTLTSPDLADNAKFGKMFTCDASTGTFGAGVNPELDWAGVPAGTKSFAMTFIDTTLGDTSPMGQHWAIWNIPWNSATGVVSKFPQGTKTLTGDLATAKQSGTFLTPCAQSLMNNMDDQYAFTIYALSTETLTVPGTGTVANALTALKAITPLGTAVLHGHAGLKGK